MGKRLAFCARHRTKPSAGQCRQCRAEMCLECRMPTEEGVFCGVDCLETFKNFRNAMVGTGPGRSRITIAALFQYAVVVSVLLALIAAALVALTGSANPDDWGRRLVEMLRVLSPI